MSSSTHSAMIMAGGTGGHVYPGLAVASALREAGWRVSWIGTARGLEARVVPVSGMTLHTLTTLGLRGKGILSRLKGVFSLLFACLQALGLLLRHRPTLVIGFGGYAAGPAGAVATILRIPVLIHEQNAVAGTTNRLLARGACRVMAGFEGAFALPAQSLVTGNPLRAEMCQQPQKTYPQSMFTPERPLRIAIMGGSQGALALNKGCPDAFAALPTEVLAALDVKHQCGAQHLDVTQDAWASVEMRNVDVMPFVEDMASLYAWADLAICRAGALTVSELAVTGTPSLLVPLPQAIDNHQMKNAEVLCKAGGACILPQSSLTDTTLARFINDIINDAARLSIMSECARAWSKPNATRDVVLVAQEVACG